MEILDLQHNTDSTKMTQPNAPDFIEQHFSIEFIEKAKMQTFFIFGALYTDFSIACLGDQNCIPTEDFLLVNLCKEESNTEASEIIYHFIHNRDFTENEVLYLTLSFLSNPKFQEFINLIRRYDQEAFDEEILKIFIGKHICKQLPLYLLDYIHSSIIRFCKEFNLIDGKIDTDTFDNIKTQYSAILVNT